MWGSCYREKSEDWHKPLVGVVAFQQKQYCRAPENTASVLNLWKGNDTTSICIWYFNSRRT